MTAMNDRNAIEDILDDCLARLKRGEDREKVLASYPEHREELEPLLRLAGELEHLPRVEPREKAVHRTLFQLGEETARMKLVSRPSYKARVWLARAAVLLLSFGLVGYGAVSLAEASLPGQFLYPLKLITEQVRLNLVRTPGGQAELRIALSEKRLQEVVSSAERGRVDQAVLDAMLREAAAALDNIEQIPPYQQEAIMGRLGSLSGRQQKVLESLKPKVPPQDRPLFDTAIRTCNQRWRWMHQRENMEPSRRPEPRQVIRQWRQMCP